MRVVWVDIARLGVVGACGWAAVQSDRWQIVSVVTPVGAWWITWSFMRRYPIALTYWRVAIGRWRLGWKVVCETVQEGRRLEELLTPSHSCAFLQQSLFGDGMRRLDATAYRLAFVGVKFARETHLALRKLTSSDARDAVNVARAVRPMLELARKLSLIDISLREASGGACTRYVAGQEQTLAIALFVEVKDAQYLLEERFGRPGCTDADWFMRILTKRREVLDALIEAAHTFWRMRDTARWISACQSELRSASKAQVDDSSAFGVQLAQLARAVDAVIEAAREVSFRAIDYRLTS